MPTFDIKVVCPECDTVAPKDNKEEAEEQVKTHNNSIHSGNEVAYVEGEHNPLTDFVEYLDDPNTESHIYYAHRNEGMLRGICPECEEIKVEQEVDILIEKLEKHNALKHDGESIAGVVTEDLDGTAADRRRPLPGNGPNAAKIIADCAHQDKITPPENVWKWVSTFFYRVKY